jgi:hypothetical protein
MTKFEYEQQLLASSYTFTLAVTDEAARIFSEIGVGTAPDMLRQDIQKINKSMNDLRTKVIRLLNESNITFCPDE